MNKQQIDQILETLSASELNQLINQIETIMHSKSVDLKTKVNLITFAINLIGNKGMAGDNNNAVVKMGDKKLLIDIGMTYITGMKRSGISYNEIDYIFLTHADPDHAQLVAALQLMKFSATPHKPTLLAFPEQIEWIRDYTRHTLDKQGMKLSDFVDIVLIEDKEFEIDGFTIRFVDTTDLHCKEMKSFGLVIDEHQTGKSLIYTSDIKDLENSQFKKYLDPQKDITIYQDCNAKGDPVHASLEEILKYYPEEYHSKINLMHLTGNFEPFKELMEEKGVKMTEANTWVAI